jgi:hypothetical protein
MWRRPKRAGLIGLALALLVPSAAQGAVTIGSNLGRAPEGIASSFGCSPPCTITQITLASDRQAPGGLVSPVNGTVVLWRIRAADDTTPTALRVIRPLTGGLWLGAGRSASVTPAANTLSTFQVQLPIAIGDSIGIDCCQPDAEYFLLSGGTVTHWNPPGLPEGGSGTPDAPVGGPHEMALNADIEPTSSIGAPTVQSKKRGKLQVTADVPNPGTFSAGDVNDLGLASAAAAHKKVKLLKRTIAPVAAPGRAALIVRPTKAARSRLSSKRALKTKLKLSFTPTGGVPSTLIVKVKLKP